MQHRILAAFIMTLTATIITTSASGQCTIITWEGSTDKCDGGSNPGTACPIGNECTGGGTCAVQHGAWRYASNWDLNRLPLATDCVVIGNDARITVTGCVIESGDFEGEDCASMNCNLSQECVATPTPDAVAYSVDYGGGWFDINPNEALTIAADSTFDGPVRLFTDAALKLDGDVFLSGAGRIEGLLAGTPQNRPEIVSATGARTLTVGSDFTLDGFLLIDVALTNNGTVHANRFWQGNGIILQRAPITGTGTWTVSKQPGGTTGILSVEAAASGGGTWRLDEADTKIVFKAASTGLSGDFEMITGTTLDIQENVTTTGNLNMSGGTIKVAKFKKALFSQ